MADSVWHHLRAARRKGIPVYHGEVLSELAEFGLDLSEFGYLLATSDNDAYNALVCISFAHELGRNRVFQLPATPEDKSPTEFSSGVRGRILIGEPATYDALMERMAAGWTFHAVTVGAMAAVLAQPESLGILAIRGSEIVVNRAGEKFEPKPDDVLIALVPPKAG